jgi:hypothetical protein
VSEFGSLLFVLFLGSAVVAVVGLWGSGLLMERGIYELAWPLRRVSSRLAKGAFFGCVVWLVFSLLAGWLLLP